MQLNLLADISMFRKERTCFFEILTKIPAKCLSRCEVPSEDKICDNILAGQACRTPQTLWYICWSLIVIIWREQEYEYCDTYKNVEEIGDEE